MRYEKQANRQKQPVSVCLNIFQKSLIFELDNAMFLFKLKLYEFSRQKFTITITKLILTFFIANIVTAEMNIKKLKIENETFFRHFKTM